MNAIRKPACLMLLLAALSGCADLNEEQRESQREYFTTLLDTPAPPEQVVATVNGRPISASALEELARLHKDATKHELLHELIDAELQYQKALEMGYADDAAMRELHARLMVQQMLKEKVHDKVSKNDIEPERVETYYKVREGWYVTPVTRIVDHILIMPSSEKWDLRKDADAVPEEVYTKAEAVSRALHKRMGGASASEFDKDAITKLAEEAAEGLPDELEVKAEFGLKTPKRSVGIRGTRGYKSGMVEEFTKRTFSTRLNTVSEPVRTVFGWHVVFVRFERPERIWPLSKVEDKFRGKLVGQDRRQLSAQVTHSASVESEIKVNYDPLSLLERGSEEGEGEGAPQ